VTDAEYALVQSQIMSIAELVEATLPIERLDAFIERIERAETMGPVLDPTLWIRAGKTMAKIKAVAIELRSLVIALEEHRA
jgi:hypothetical protein